MIQPNLTLPKRTDTLYCIQTQQDNKPCIVFCFDFGTQKNYILINLIQHQVLERYGQDIRLYELMVLTSTSRIQEMEQYQIQNMTSYTSLFWSKQLVQLFGQRIPCSQLSSSTRRMVWRFREVISSDKHLLQRLHGNSALILNRKPKHADAEVDGDQDFDL